MTRFIAAIDQGTTSSRCIIFDHAGQVAASVQREHRQIFPEPGWVEHDPLEIWDNVQTCIKGALDRLNLKPNELAAVGITNQRETTLLWDRATGAPLGPAIVWQDTRTDRLVRDLAGDAGPDRFRERCGLPLATYFSGPKIRWLLDATPGAQAAAKAGAILFGTMDSWLIWKLTGRHVTDVTNASRTMLINLRTLDWDLSLLDAFGVPRGMLPTICASSEIYGVARGVLEGVPVSGVLGDQQAALVGQACFAPGEAKCTYGTGAFLLSNTGDVIAPSTSGLLTTVAYRFGDAPAAYALEGSIAVSGALIQWLRDNLGLIERAADVEALAKSVPDSGGCYIVPAFSGLFAPHWRADARGVIAGLSGFVTKAHLARAALEATAWQTCEVVEAMATDSGVALAELRVDGGMTANSLLMQMIADVLGAPVVRPQVSETTCLGAAYAAGLATGFWPDLDSLKRNWREAARWTPSMAPAVRAAGRRGWDKAVDRTLGWVDGD